MSKTIKTISGQAEAAGVCRRTIKKWRERPDWVAAEDGSVGVSWLRKCAIARLEERRAAQAGENADLKRKKLAAQIKRLDVQVAIDAERLKREKIESQKLENELWPRREVIAEWCVWDKRIVAVIEGFRQRETAKLRTLEAKQLIDGLCDGVLDELRIEFEGNGPVKDEFDGDGPAAAAVRNRSGEK